jgi:hypothetical protein
MNGLRPFLFCSQLLSRLLKSYAQLNDYHTSFVFTMPNLLIITEDSNAQFESCFRIQFFHQSRA